MLNIESFRQASRRLDGVIHKTSFSYAPILSKLSGYEVYLKKENLQRTGSFKLRGAFNKIATLVEQGNIRGVVASSAGNHAQGVAFAASHFGLDATIVMPESTPLTKIQGVKEFGANVILHGSNYDDAYAFAMEHAAKNDAIFVHPFADDDVIAGQGTIALEMLQEIPDLSALIVPIGGGGLVSGVGACAKCINPEIKILGASAAGAPAMKQSYDAKTAIDTLQVRTIADGIAVRDTSPVTLSYIIECVDAMFLVGEDEIANAILFLLERQKLLVEGAGAAGVAALMYQDLGLPKGSKVGIVISGGNIDVTMLSLIIEKGLTKSGRKMKLMVTLVDKPGALMKFTEILSSVAANIVHIGYDRTSIDLDFGDAHVSVALETKGEAHQEQIRQKLKSNGFVFSEIN